MEKHPMEWLIKRLDLSQKYNLDKTMKSCLDSLVPVLQLKEARIMIFVKHWLFLAPFVVEDDRLWDPVSRVLMNVGEADKEQFFVAASLDRKSYGLIFKLLRALFEKEYAMTQDVTFP